MRGRHGVHRLQHRECRLRPLQLRRAHRSFVRIAIAADTDGFCAPCGVCRQVLREFAEDMEVILVNRRGETQELTLKELLPYSFNSGILE